MSARTLRRTFATPFVVTTLAACTVQQGQPMGTAQHPGHGREAKPTDNGMQPRPTDVAQSTAPTQDGDTSEQHWSIQKQGGSCQAFTKVSCPPNTACNPPRPQPYACMPDMAEGASINVVRWAGNATCVVETAPMSCPKGMMCNPPPPQQVACPK